MAEDFFGDITAAPKNDFFGDIKPAEPDQRGIVARTTEGFKGAYRPMLEGALDKVAGENFKTEHPYLHAGAEALLSANPVSWLDKAITGVTAGVAGAAPGVGAGLAEAGGMSRANADRLQRDLGIVGQGLMVEPGMGLAAARKPEVIRLVERAPAEPPAAAAPVQPAERAPAPPRAAEPVYDAITGERVDNLPEVARSEVPPEEAALPTVDSRGEERPPAEARAPAEAPPPDFFADITEEPPARVTERIPDEAAPAGRPEEVAPTLQEPPLAKGMMRLYRGDTAAAQPSSVPDWVRETPEYKATVESTGRWFVAEREIAEYYNRTFGDRAGHISYVDVPAKEAERYLAANQPGAAEFSAAGREREEFFIPREWANRSQSLAFTKETKAPPESAVPNVDSRPAKTVKEKPPETLSSYIARNGGLELTPEARDMGLHKRFIPGAGNVARKNGRSLDKFWRERLAEAGYIDRDPDGGIQRDIRGELYEKLGGSEPAYSKFDRPPELKVDPRSADIERQAKIIQDAFEKEGLSKTDIDTEALYEAADLLYRGEAKDPFEAYDRAATRLGDREDAQPRGMRGESTEIYPPGSEGTGPRIEKAVAGTGEGMQGPGSAGRVPGKEVRKSQAMSRVYEPGAEGKPQLVLPGAERVTAAELAKRKVAESLAARQKQEKLTGKVPQKPMDEGLFGEGYKQEDLFAQAAKKPDQSLIQRQEIERGRSGRPTKTKPIPIGTEEAILERGYEKTTGPKGEPREPGIEPKLRDVTRRIARSYKETFQPEAISEGALRADPLFAKRASVRAQEHDQILREGAKRYTQWNKIPEDRRIAFLGQVERGQATAPEFRGIARVYRGMLDKAYQMEKRWGSKAGYINDYFPHLWERPTPGQAPIAAFMEARVQALGPTWFQKARTIDLIEEGLAAGYKLRSTNPEALMNMRLMSGADMRASMQLLNDLRGMDLATKVTETNRSADILSREGWQKINAPDREQWMIAPDVQALWKNGVEAKGFWSHEGLAGDAFRGWMGFKNVWIPIKLALSAFHPLHVAGINLASGWARAADQMMAGHVGGALKSIGQGVSLYQGVGKRARAAWVMGEQARTPEGKLAVKTMNEGGFSPMLSEQLRIDAGRKLSDAWRDMSPFKGAYHGLRYGIQKLQAPIFEHWIPHLKAAAYLNDAAAVLRRNPELGNDPIARGVALRAIAKSVDNRFGEMFYGTLFWNRYVKDASIGSFLSLGWNLGFVREFGGAAMESVTRPASIVKKPSETRQIIRDSTNKIKFAGIYFGTSALMGAAITYAFTGEEPKDANDYIFPRAGGVNPDGSPRRFTTMSYLREGPMLQKHIQEYGGGVGGTISGTAAMVYNKLLFQPAVELWHNRSYFGSEIYDTNAPGYQQFAQALKHIGGQQLSPMSVTGAQRARETGGTKTEEYMAYLGFGPAPAYAERSAIQNRITHLYQKSVAPEARPYEEEETSHARMTARAKVLMAKQKGDPEEIKAARAEGLKAGLSVTYMNELGKISTDQRMFRRLPENHQMAILGMATEQERERYWPYAKKKTREKWNAEHAPVGRAEGGAVGDDYNTNLGGDEAQFQTWKSEHAPRDSGADYDLRGAYRAGIKPDQATGHWPDTYKKPNHPTFSDQSQYAKDAPEKAGRWEGETYIRPKLAEGGTVDEQRNARAVFARDKAAADAMLPAPGRALEDRLNKGAWESRFGRYGTAPESENIEDRRAFGFRRTGRFIGGFKRGGDSGKV